MITPSAEHQRLAEMEAGRADWRHWDTCVNRRGWVNVREDYSESGDAWKLIKLKRSDLIK